MVGRERRLDRSDLASMAVCDLRYGVRAQIRAVVRPGFEMQALRIADDGDDGQKRIEADLSTSKGSLMKPPKELDQIVDKVLAYKAPARSPKAKKRQRKRRQIRRESCI